MALDRVQPVPWVLGLGMRLRPEGKDWNDDLRAKRGGHG